MDPEFDMKLPEQELLDHSPESDKIREFDQEVLQTSFGCASCIDPQVLERGPTLPTFTTDYHAVHDGLVGKSSVDDLAVAAGIALKSWPFELSDPDGLFDSFSRGSTPSPIRPGSDKNDIAEASASTVAESTDSLFSSVYKRRSSPTTIDTTTTWKKRPRPRSRSSVGPTSAASSVLFD
jgi:hypothetical protein